MQEHGIFLPFFLGISWFWFDFGFLRKSFSVKPWLSWNFLCIPGWSRILRFAGIKGLYHSCPAWLSFNIQEYLNLLLKSLVYFDSLKITHYSKIIKGTISNIKVYHWGLKDYRNSFFFFYRDCWTLMLTSVLSGDHDDRSEFSKSFLYLMPSDSSITGSSHIVRS